MAVERTFAIIKPDAVRKKVAGQIINRIEEAGLEIVAMKKIQLTSRARRASTPCTRSAPSSTIWSPS